MIESLITNISLAEKASKADVLSLLQVCRRDIVDLFPKNQKRITENAWNTVKKVTLTEPRDVVVYNYALDAFIFQNMEIDVEEFLSDMKAHGIVPNGPVHENLFVYHCDKKDIDNALSYLQSHTDDTLVFNNRVASALIYCHCSRGEFTEADNVVTMLDQRNIFYGRSVPHSYIRGTARLGDVDRLTEYIDLYNPGDDVLLEALYQLVQVAPDQAQLILDRLPVDKSLLSSRCRRTVKRLVELGELETAEKLVLLTEEVSENTSVKLPAIETSPSVIVLGKILEQEKDPEQAIARIYSMQSVDTKIVERSITKLFDHCIKDPEKMEFCKTVIRELLKKRNNKVRGPTQELMSQNIARRIKKCQTDNDVLYLLKMSSDLGIKLTHVKEWNAAFCRLIPDHDKYTVKDLFDRVTYVRECLDCISMFHGGVYSTSVIWSQIFKYLVSTNHPVFIKTTAHLVKSLGVTYGPLRWFDGLGHNLVNTHDAVSFVDILEVAYKNCQRRGDGEDYRQLSAALIVAVKAAQRKQENIDAVLEEIFDLLWERNLMLHIEIRDGIVNNLDNQILAETASNLPVIAFNNFMTVSPVSMVIRKANGKKKKSKSEL